MFDDYITPRRFVAGTLATAAPASLAAARKIVAEL
jgi:hypothetical protein